MAYNLEEQERIDELKALWARWGNLVTTLVTVAALAVAGWFGWQRWQDYQAQQAAVAFAQLQQAIASRDAQRIRTAATQLTEQHGRTAYAQMGALIGARADLDVGEAAGAKELLRWAADHARDEAFRHLARLRLAGLLLDDKAYDQGLELLAGSPPEPFAAQYANRRGDLLIAQGKRDEARNAYQQALAKLDERSPLRDVVRLKLDALGGAAA